MLSKPVAWVALLAAASLSPGEWSRADETAKTETRKETETVTANPIVVMKTSKGVIEIELLPEKAPLTVANFLQYVDDGFYDGTICHRVIDGFMVQAGGFATDMKQKKNRPPIKNEADNGLKNLRGTLSMARTADVNSATSQFFMNLVDNAFLDHGSRDFGYAVFAKIVGGLEVLEAIGKVPTTVRAGHRDVPVEAVVVESVTRKKAE